MYVPFLVFSLYTLTRVFCTCSCSDSLIPPAYVKFFPNFDVSKQGEPVKRTGMLRSPSMPLPRRRVRKVEITLVCKLLSPNVIYRCLYVYSHISVYTYIYIHTYVYTYNVEFQVMYSDYRSMLGPKCAYGTFMVA